MLRMQAAILFYSRCPRSKFSKNPFAFITDSRFALGDAPAYVAKATFTFSIPSPRKR